MTDSTTIEGLLKAFRKLSRWNNAGEFSAEDWRRYAAAARLVQESEPVNVERALSQFLDEAQGVTGVENETRLFLLLRIVFDLPERAPSDRRTVFKGWTNWPVPDEEGHVNLSWPIDWRDGQPVLLARFEGAKGPRYGAVEEYRYLLDHFSFRELQKRKGSKRRPKERTKRR